MKGEVMDKECTCGWMDPVGRIHDQRCPVHADWKWPTQKEMTHCPYCSGALTRETVDKLPECLNCGGKGVISLYQPEPPKPTRKEWETWSLMMAWLFHDQKQHVYSVQEVERAFMEMPGIPKE
jgi:hypothetical protein